MRRECGKRIPPPSTNVHLETNHLSSQVGEALRAAITATSFGHELLSVLVAEFPQSAEERTRGWIPRFGTDLVGRQPKTQDPDPKNLAGGLGKGRAARRDAAKSEACDEDPPVDQSVTSCPKK